MIHVGSLSVWLGGTSLWGGPKIEVPPQPNGRIGRSGNGRPVVPDPEGSGHRGAELVGWSAVRREGDTVLEA